MIELRKIYKNYGNKIVLDDVSLKLKKAECLVLVGASGSGKSTLLKIINRLIAPSGGEVYFDGKNADLFPAHQLSRKIGYVFQQIGLFPHLSIAENIALPLSLALWDKKTIAARIDELLELLNLDFSLKSRRPKELSGGQQQRVGFARALALSPKIMLLDEPFGALDPLVREQLQQSFLDLKIKLNFTSVIVTHDIYEAMILGDRIGILKEGKLLQLASLSELINRPKDSYVEQLLSTPLRQYEILAQLRAGTEQ